MDESEFRRQRRMAMRGVPERLGLAFGQGNIEMRGKPSGHGTTNFEWNGYAAVYGVEFPMWDPHGEPYSEQVAYGVSKRSLNNPNLDVPFLIGHNDAGIPLARTKSGTMTLSEDTTGTHTYVPAMDGRREEVRALASAVERGDMDEMSLAFVCTRQEWDPSFEKRTIVEWDLHRGDVCAVVHGANPATAGAWMAAVEQLSFRRPAAIGGPVLLRPRRGRERRMPTAPYTVRPGEDNACPQCQSMNDRDAYFCDQCGATMPGGPVGAAAAEMGGDETQQCQSCLCMNATDAKYCDQCGRELAGIRPYVAPGGGYLSDWSDGRPRERRAAHGPFTGTHTHAHPAMGDQGGDDSHEHEHSHDGDADHGHAHEARASARLTERRASAADDTNLSFASDYGATAAPHSYDGTHQHDGADCGYQCAPHAHTHSAGGSANVMVDDSTGIPGEETQFSAARRLELRLRELELEELAGVR